MKIFESSNLAENTKSVMLYIFYFKSSEKPSNNHKCQGGLHICSRLQTSPNSSQHSFPVINFIRVL